MNRVFQRGYQRRFHYLNPDQLNGLARLRSMIRSRDGHALVIGPGGTGKTALLKRIIEECRAENTRIVELRTPPESVDALIETLVKQLQPGVDLPASRAVRIQVLQQMLSRHPPQARILICVDEAQSASDLVLLSLLQLADTGVAAQTVRASLVMAGTETLTGRLSDLTGQPLEQLVRMVISLAPFDQDEVAAFIRHQLAAAEIEDEHLFQAEAVRQIAALSGGIASEVNSFCGLALCVMHLEGARQVTPEIVAQVSRESWIIPEGRAAAVQDPSPPPESAPDTPAGTVGLDAGTGQQLERAMDLDSQLHSVATSANRTDWSLGSAPGRPRREARWGWLALAVLFVAVATSYLVRNHPPDDGSSNSVQSAIRATSPTAASPREAITEVGPSVPVTAAAAGDDQTAPIGGATTNHHATAGPDQAGRSADTALASVRPTAASEAAQSTPDPVPEAPTQAPFDGRIALIDPRQPASRQSPATTPLPKILAPYRLTARLSEPATVRRRPSTRAPVLAERGAGDRVTITGRIDGSDWLQIIEPFGEFGYVYAELVRVVQPGTETSTTASAHELKLSPRDENGAALLEVPALLEAAAQHLAADRLLAPRFDNALYLYREVLRIDPENARAHAGVRRIATRLIGHARDAQNRGDLEEAKRALEKVLVVDSADTRARLLLEQLQTVRVAVDGGDL